VVIRSFPGNPDYGHRFHRAFVAVTFANNSTGAGFGFDELTVASPKDVATTRTTTVPTGTTTLATSPACAGRQPARHGLNLGTEICTIKP
jgi:hypothetical protein